MNPTLRRILLIAALVLVTIGFLFVIYLVFFRGGPVGNVNNAPGGNVNGLPGIGNGNINGLPQVNVNALPLVNGLPDTQQPSNLANGGPTFVETVVESPTSELASTSNNTFRYYDQASGQFYELNADGTTKSLLSDAVYRNVRSADWSPDGNKAILSFPDGSKVLYDFTNKKQSTLPKELDDFTFSPQSDQIASKFLNPSNPDDQWLLVSQPDGSQAETAEHLGENARLVTPTWSPGNQIIATYEKSSTADLSEIIFLGAQGENFPSATIEGRGFIPRWSPDGRRLMYSAYSANTNDNPRLYLMNASPESIGTNLIDLGLNTRADKCAFAASGLSIYCAVPYYLRPGSGPQPELSRDVPDNIYRIDLFSGAAELIARPIDRNLNQRFSGTNVQVSADERWLFFVDQTTGQLQKIQLR